MPHHASPEPWRRPRPWKLAAVLALALVPATVASGLVPAFQGTAEVGTPAQRIWSTRSGGLLFPMEPAPMCEFLNNFGERRSTHVHQGVDIGSTEGQAVYAVEDGVVSEVDPDPAGDAGIGVRLVSDSEVQYRYYHLSAIAGSLAAGQRVARGDVLGYTGDTGNPIDGAYHLHFEVRPKAASAGKPYDTPVDPAPLLAIPSRCRIYGTIDGPNPTTTTSSPTIPSTSSTTTLPPG